VPCILVTCTHVCKLELRTYTFSPITTLFISIYSSMKETANSPPRTSAYDDDVETDGNNRKTHYRGNNKKAGYIVYTVSIYT